MNCKNCNKNSLKRIVKIGKQPLSGFFYSRKKTKLKKFSLDLYKCSKCNLVQLNNLIDIKKMYGEHYGYRTSLSKMMISHLKEKIQRLKKLRLIKKNDNILDIGSNDASFLKLLGKYFLYMFVKIIVYSIIIFKSSKPPPPSAIIEFFLSSNFKVIFLSIFLKILSPLSSKIFAIF